MVLRRVWLASFLFIITAVANAQGTVELFKGKTVIFIVPENQLPFIDDYKKLLPQAWTLTPMEVVRWGDIDRYPEGDKNIFLAIHGNERSATARSGNRLYNNQYYLTLSPKIVQESKPGKDEFCRVELHSDFSTDWVNTQKDPIDRFYNNYTFPNFSLPYMMGYLRFMQKNIQTDKFPSEAQAYNNKEMLQQLAGETLYLPIGQPENVFKEAYEGKFESITSQNLVNLIKTNTTNKPIFVFEFVVSGSNKYIGVLDITTGTVVYRRQVPLSNTLKSNDVAKILK